MNNRLVIHLPIRRSMGAIQSIELRNMMKNGIRLLAFFSLMAATAASQAQPLPSPLGRFQDWDGYQAAQNGKPYCYILSTPKTAPSNDAHISITRFLGRGLEQQVNISFGTHINGGQPVQAVIDGQKRFELQSHSETGGWFADVKQEKQFVDALKKGQWLVVQAQGDGDEKFSHRYSLFGITAAHNAMQQNCS